MYLYQDIDLFTGLVNEVSENMGISECIVEKDYYIFMLLKLIHNKVGDEVVFKGGTSLSKAHSVISRFSEDIDLCLQAEKIKSSGARRRLIHAIEEAISELGLKLIAVHEIQSRNTYNKIAGRYNTVSKMMINGVEPDVKIETAHWIKEFPYRPCKISSYLGEYTMGSIGADFVHKYNLESFSILTVEVLRTFIDKLFAVADYYIQGKNKNYSRHLYDLYKIIESNRIIMDDFYPLFNEVRLERQVWNSCPSAKNNSDLKKILCEALNSDFYRDDYSQHTFGLLIHDYVLYDMCKFEILNFVKSLKI